jgi:hypothetical protein
MLKNVDCKFNCLTFIGTSDFALYSSLPGRFRMGIKGERSEFILTLDSLTTPESFCMVVC